MLAWRSRIDISIEHTRMLVNYHLSKHLFIHSCTPLLLIMRGSRNFRQGGGGPGQIDKKALATFFLVLSLFYTSQMVNFKENYPFSRFQRGSNIFQGGGGVQLFPGGGGFNCLFPIETHITCDFPGGAGPPVTPPPPLDPHLLITA